MAVALNNPLNIKIKTYNNQPATSLVVENSADFEYRNRKFEFAKLNFEFVETSGNRNKHCIAWHS